VTQQAWASLKAGSVAPSLIQRFGFGAAFAVAGYALAAGDKENGSGIASGAPHVLTLALLDG
jgi:hypothetical protein